MRTSAPFSDYLVKSLRDPQEAAAFVEAAFQENDDRLLLKALRVVAEAQGWVAKVASRTKLNRVSLYRMLSDKGNPELSSLIKVMEALGLRLAVLAKLPGRVKRVHKGPLTAKRAVRPLGIRKRKVAA
jgi:probable addiction module antidote protein